MARRPNRAASKARSGRRNPRPGESGSEIEVPVQLGFRNPQRPVPHAMYGQTSLQHVLEVGGSHAHPFDERFGAENLSQALLAPGDKEFQDGPRRQGVIFADVDAIDECCRDGRDVQGASQILASPGDRSALNRRFCSFAPWTHRMLPPPAGSDSGLHEPRLGGSTRLRASHSPRPPPSSG